MENLTEILEFIASGSAESMIIKISVFIVLIVIFLFYKYGEKQIEFIFKKKSDQKEKDSYEEKIQDAVEEIVEEVTENFEEKITGLQKSFYEFYVDKGVTTLRVPLIEHPLFASLKEMDMFFTIHLKLHDHGREMLMKEKVIPKIRIWYDILYKMAQDVQNCISTCNNCSATACGKSYMICQNAFINGIEEYRNYHLAHPISLTRLRYTDEDIKTMNIYSQKFNEYHSPSERMTSDSIDRVFKSIAYKDCYTRAWDVLNAYLYAFNRVRIDSESAIRNLNGELTGLTFLGHTIGDFDHDFYDVK